METKIEKLVREQEVVINRDNAETLQTQALCYIEDGTPLSEDYLKKVANFSAMYNIPPAKVIAETAASDVVAAFLSKKASRQRHAEIAQIEYLNKCGLKVSSLPQCGPEALRLSAGEFVKGDTSAVSSKAIDARNKSNGDFISAKFTTLNGGAQKNSFEDIIHYMQEARAYVKNHPDFNGRFIALLDGKFYRDKSVISQCRALEVPGKVIACASDNYVSICKG